MFSGPALQGHRLRAGTPWLQVSGAPGQAGAPEWLMSETRTPTEWLSATGRPACYGIKMSGNLLRGEKERRWAGWQCLAVRQAVCEDDVCGIYETSGGRSKVKDEGTRIARRPTYVTNASSELRSRCLMHVEEMNGTWVKVLFLLMKLRREPTTEAKNQITL
ncbi:unnamed protein product [Arctogadus glacialis]